MEKPKKLGFAANVLLLFALAITDLGRGLIRLACWLDDVDFEKLEKEAKNG